MFRVSNSGEEMFSIQMKVEYLKFVLKFQFCALFLVTVCRTLFILSSTLGLAQLPKLSISDF